MDVVMLSFLIILKGHEDNPVVPCSQNQEKNCFNTNKSISIPVA